MELAGGRPPALAKEYFKKQAKARSIIPAEVPALLPEASMKNLQLRMDAQVAKQRPLPGAKSSVDQDLVEKERGEIIARRAANSRVSFEAYDAQRYNIEANLDAQRQMEAGKRIIQLTGENGFARKPGHKSRGNDAESIAPSAGQNGATFRADHKQQHTSTRGWR